jgi:lipoprotein-anchoring transpeptidase ErfK/SrfK
MRRPLAVAAAVLMSGAAHGAHAADEAMPPWADPGDVPMPVWAKSVTPNRAEAAIYSEPGKLDQRRGSAQPGARLPFFGTKRASGCQGRWLAVGPLAWICSDVADFTGDEPQSPQLGSRTWTSEGVDFLRPTRPGARGLPPIDPVSANDDGLPYRYYFAGREGAYGFMNLQNALDDPPDQELEAGFAIAATEEASAHGEKWVKTKKGRWVAARELAPARPFLFHGELAKDGKLDVAWVIPDKAPTYVTAKADKAKGQKVRFEKLKVVSEQGAMIELEGGEWMKAKDVSRPRATPPPAEIGGEAATERWIDVDLAQQVLVAYEGPKPVFATLVSTGKGPVGSEFETRKGAHRIWVKIFTTKMDNLDKDDVDKHYAIEDVPWVQFFDKAIALHGAFWHRDFGHVHSHGCVNLTPLDARWLFAFTGPHLPAGWTAVLPTKMEPGTMIRVR